VPQKELGSRVRNEKSTRCESEGAEAGWLIRRGKEKEKKEKIKKKICRRGSWIGRKREGQKGPARIDGQRAKGRERKSLVRKYNESVLFQSFLISPLPLSSLIRTNLYFLLVPNLDPISGTSVPDPRLHFPASISSPSHDMGILYGPERIEPDPHPPTHSLQVVCFGKPAHLSTNPWVIFGAKMYRIKRHRSLPEAYICSISSLYRAAHIRFVISNYPFDFIDALDHVLSLEIVRVYEI